MIRCTGCMLMLFSLLCSAYADEAAGGAAPARDTAPEATPPPAVEGQAGSGKYPRVPPAERRVGLAYTTWHRTLPWPNVWGEPALGYYASWDRRVIRRHAAWLYDAGVDFVWIDWSNNVNYTPNVTQGRPDFDGIEGSTYVMFEEWAALEHAPGICIFLGCPGEPEAATDGRLQAKADQVHDLYIGDPRFRKLWPDYLGKPLLLVYAGTPTPWQTGPGPWDDERFTVRWVTGYVSEQGALRTQDRISHDYWSWEDRGPATFTVHDGRPEAMTVTASWREQAPPNYVPARGRMGGQTFREAWERARVIGPRFAMVVSWNEWVLGEQISAEAGKDLEPSKLHGDLYLRILKEEIAKFKATP